MAKQTILDKYKGLSVSMVGPNGEKYVVTKPLSKTAVEKQLRENKNEFGSFVTDYIRGREVSYERFDDYTLMTFRVWEPGGSYSTDPNAYTKKTKVKNTSARNMAIAFILD